MSFDNLINLIKPVVRYRTIREFMRFVEACKYLDWHVWAKEAGSITIKNALLFGKPQAIGKIGSVELQAIRSYLRLRHQPDWQHVTQIYRHTLYTNAGVFPDQPEIFQRYCEYMIDAILPEITIVATSNNFGEAKIVSNYAPSAKKVPLRSLEVFYISKNHWTSVLAQKTVLVIHPFVDSIRQQFEKRKKLWPGREHVLPDFKLVQIKVPQHATLVAPFHPDWFSSLKELQQQMSMIDFDIAFIGAGAYSLPLAVQAKKLGRHGVHLGGATQIYFGIKGRRWDNHPVVSKFYNEQWIRPLSQDTPSNNGVVEDGCYW